MGQSEEERIMIGSSLGHYEILSAIGKGGMGEVWRARDTKLGREVAIKTLPAEFAQDADRLARFQREAKLLASLNHPNIAAIYGLEEANGTRFLVLELVEGDTLAERLHRGALPVEESLKLALQIAEALEAAHEKGVVHRDLKPANIKITKEGKVKVLDFGLAKAVLGDTADVSLSNSPTLSMAGTQQGIILGTAAYMSPEQASGETTDKRADIWAFGVVLFEMLTGRPVFTGKTVSHILADVLRADPEWGRLPVNLHPRLRMLLERCLEKDARNRYHDIADARVDIERVLADPKGVQLMPALAAASSWRFAAALAGVAVVAGAIAGVAAWNLRSPSPIGPAARLTINLPEDQELAGFRQMSPVAVSRNGDVAYVGMSQGTQQLFLRQLGSREATPIRGTDGAEGPFFSPDGQELGFFAGAWLKTVPIRGGNPTQLARASIGRGGSWGDDGYIYFATVRSNGILRVPQSGGEPQSITIPGQTAAGFEQHRYPQALPGGKALLYTIGTGGSWDDALIVAESLDTNDRKILIRGGSDARYVPAGYLLFVRGGKLMAAGFNLERLEAGDPVPVEVADSVMQSTDITGASFIGMSEPGALVYVPGTFQATDRKLYWVNREGRPEPLAVRADSYNRFRLSPDGRQVAIEIDQGVQQQIWIHNMSQPEILRLLSREGAHNQTPTYKSVGQVSYAADANIVSQSADGSNAPEFLVKKQRQMFYPDWCLDGRFLAWDDESSRLDRDVWYVTPGAGDEPHSYLDSEANEQHPRFSPQCDLLAYASDESGRDEIYVQSFPNEGRQQVSSGGVFLEGFAWARRGRQLFYLNGSRMMAVDIETKPSLSVVQTKELFETPFPVSPNFDVGPDGRFLMIRVEERHPREINVDLNWLQDLPQGASTP